VNPIIVISMPLERVPAVHGGVYFDGFRPSPERRGGVHTPDLESSIKEDAGANLFAQPACYRRMNLPLQKLCFN